MRAALATLNAAQQEVIELGYFGGLCSAEIAERVRIPIGLQGSALDDRGETHTAGDVLVLEAGSTHSFRSGAGAPLIFAVSVNGVRFDP